MDDELQRRQVDENYDAFERLLPALLPAHRDQYALMRDQRIVGFFDEVGDANRAGHERFADDIFSIREVTDRPIELGAAGMFG